MHNNTLGIAWHGVWNNIRREFEIEILRLEQFVKQQQNLNAQLILPQVVSILVNN